MRTVVGRDSVRNTSFGNRFGRIDLADRKGPLNSTTRKVRCEITLFEKLSDSLIEMAFRSILSLDERSVRSLI
ncbi:hypothetical protein L596_000571 [Steinernema carpocapsae]|uniref:Uncharacterized protein n=1 Tax=Steinernema carpocapsae TaxID=34508 RepID=A0A4U8UIG7_STECR|nr:hypothetical protein L596_000571 [Steinernema carpocapsae]